MAHEATHHANPFDPGHLFGHIQDAEQFDVPKFLVPPEGVVKIPQPFISDTTEGRFHGFHITKFMLIEVVVALVIALVFIRLANRMSKSDVAQGEALEFAGSDSRLPARSSGATGDRSSRCRRVFALPVDAVFLCAWLQSVWPVAVGRLADRGACHNRGVGADDVCHRGRHRHEEDGICRLFQIAQCRTSTCLGIFGFRWCC